MFRWYFRRLCICVVLFTFLFLLARDRTKNSINTSALTQLHPKPWNDTTGAFRRKPSFFVFSPQCKIPYVDPFAKELLRWEPLKLETCPDGPNLFSISFDRARERYRVHLNKTVAEKHFASYFPFGCTYIEITPGSNNSSAQSKPINFNPDWIVPAHFLGMIVQCHALANTSRVMQRDAFTFVQNPRNPNIAKTDAKKPSVFIFGIESMSRMNFRRTMPLTSKFVGEDGWFEMEGYNSVGDNKMNNLAAILTDGTRWKDKLLCDPRNPACLYDLTLVWKHFRNAGYLTAYAEDVTSDYFDHLGMASLRQPVDFYMRPFLVAVEKVFKTVKNFGLCLGRRNSFSYVFDFAKQLIERYVLEHPTPLFGLFWTSTLTQNDFRGGRTLDELFVRYLEEFQNYGLFENSIVILISDRGSSQGLLVDHPSGFLEERLPMLHIYIPEQYHVRYPSVVRALELNRNRLSSNCDLHLGVRQVVQQARPGIWFVESTYTCHSIMKILPKNRGCDVASIPPKWCACEPFLRVPIEDSFAQIASVVVYRMNKFLRRQKVAKECYLMVLNKVLKAERQLHYDEKGIRVPSPSGLETIRLVFTTKPKGVVFWSLVHSNNDTNYVKVQLEMITRLGPDSNDSYCVDDEMAKQFCICRNS
ncbi:uncharacterized protein [Drosophila kikkawai]|uniref:Uncharacterized protein n=1 Tax=Drosophila kikkawai TaxID=30033 RepID=A0A6P4JGF7_DROKI|nr:uncharacterized protein LOC108082689 [Drosophila kikkawai]